ncbi:ATP-dependent helicase [Vibrio vulnificus]|nr:ATP-dependent helicase [Vibrio vulnificus]
MTTVTDLTSLLHGLTPRQSLGVTAKGKTKVVTAGAGAGKTSVLTRCVVQAIWDTPSPALVAAITFTGDAAYEMRERVVGFVGKTVAERAVISTFHSFALNYILKPHWTNPLIKSWGYTNKVVKLETSLVVVRALYKQAVKLSLSSKQQGHYSRLLEDADKDFSAWLSLTRSYGMTPITYFSSMSTEFESIEQLIGLMDKLTCDHAINHYHLKVWLGYEQLLRERESIDFDQVLVLSMLLLEQDKVVRADIRRRFPVLHVDEFQDTNLCQYRMVLAMVGDGAQFSAFGDIKQAIYGFRGCNCYLMANMTKHFTNAHIINLPDNFRSTDKVVNAGNALADVMRIQLTSEPMIAHKSSSVMPTTVRALDVRSMAHWVIDRILSLKAQGVNGRDIGLLYRFNRIGQEIENFLISRNIPYERLGSDKGLYEEPDIRSIVIFLHMIFNPFSTQVVFAFFAEHKKFGINSDQVRGALKALMSSHGNKVNNHALLSYILDNKLCSSENAHTALGNFTKVIFVLSKALSQIDTFERYCQRMNVQYSGVEQRVRERAEKELGDAFILARREFVSQLSHYYLTHSLFLFDGDKERKDASVKRSKPINAELFGLVFNALFDESFAETDARKYICSRPLLGLRRMEPEVDDAKIQLMTVHASKGLEKQAVFLLGCTDQQWFKDEVEYQSDDYEEELRLFYVATTRAIEHLYYVFPETTMFRNNVRICQPHRFLEILDSASVVEHYYYHAGVFAPCRLDDSISKCDEGAMQGGDE